MFDVNELKNTIAVIGVGDTHMATSSIWTTTGSRDRRSANPLSA